MNTIGESERYTQNRIIKLFCEQLHYKYLGNWEDHANNSNIEEGLFLHHLISLGTSPTLVMEQQLYSWVFDIAIFYGEVSHSECNEITISDSFKSLNQQNRLRIAI